MMAPTKTTATTFDETSVAGAVCLSKLKYRMPPYVQYVYELVDMHHADKLLDGASDQRDEENEGMLKAEDMLPPIMGSDMSRIVAELQGQFPAPEGGTRVVLVYNFEVNKIRSTEMTKQRWRRYYCQYRRIPRSLVILRCPLFWAELSLPQLRKLAHNRNVLIPRTHSGLFAEIEGDPEWLITSGYAIRNSDGNDVVTSAVCFRPEFVQRKEHANRVNTYEDRMSGAFPDGLVSALFRRLTDIPHSVCKFSNWVFRQPETAERYGWVCRRNFQFDVNDVNVAVAFLRKLGVPAFWRSTSDNNSDYQLFKSLLLYWHGANKLAREKKQTQLLAFCSFLRAEARAMKIEMPRPPVKPKPLRLKRFKG